MKTPVSFNPHKKPDPVAADLKRITSLTERNNLVAAEAETLKLLQTHPKRPDVHNMMGIIYIRQKKPNRAGPHLEFAVKAEPENSFYLSNLGRLYLDLRFIELALPFLRKALTIDPNLTATLLALGMYYTHVGKAEQALPYFERLRVIAPHDNNVKWKLADSFDALGRKAEADVLYQQLRRTDSHIVPALRYFSQNEPAHGSAALIGEIEQLLLRQTLSNHSRSLLHASLGFIFERAGNHQLAFTHFDEAGRLRSLDFDIGKYRAWVDRVIAVFTADLFRKYSGAGNPSSLPVLVVGMPRSGTTLTEQMIASHSRVGGAGELPRIEYLATGLDYSPKRDISGFVPALEARGAKALRELGDNYADLLKFHAPTADRVVDKMPHNFQFLGLVALICPQARIIHCTRNPLDTCLSCYQNPLRDGHAYSKDLTHLGYYYREYKRLMDHWKTVLPLQIHELNYERFTADFEGEARKVIDFIGLPWDENCLKFHEAGRTVHTLSRGQVRDPVHGKSVGRWRHYEKELQPLISALDHDDFWRNRQKS